MDEVKARAMVRRDPLNASDPIIFRDLPATSPARFVFLSLSLQPNSPDFDNSAFSAISAVPNSMSRLNALSGLCIAIPQAEGGISVTLRHTIYDSIPGTIVFDGRRAMLGYALNKMCYSFNSTENRDAFCRDEAAYCAKFALTSEQRRALAKRDVLQLLESGGNIYYLAKWAGIFGLNIQQIGAQQRGMTEEQFKEMLVRAGRE